MADDVRQCKRPGWDTYPLTDLSHDLCDGFAKGGEAVQDGDPDQELRI